MSNIIIKDCNDFKALQDGTITGDMHYCDLSLECRQLGMKSDWYNFYNHETGTYEFDYFCTGMKVTEETKNVDEEVS